MCITIFVLILIFLGAEARFPPLFSTQRAPLSHIISHLSPLLSNYRQPVVLLELRLCRYSMVPAQAQASSSKTSSNRRPEDDDLKPYVIGQEIGKGSFATVYKGYHEVCVVKKCD
jgi:hypothetical protein